MVEPRIWNRGKTILVEANLVMQEGSRWYHMQTASSASSVSRHVSRHSGQRRGRAEDRAQPRQRQDDKPQDVCGGDDPLVQPAAGAVSTGAVSTGAVSTAVAFVAPASDDVSIDRFPIGSRVEVYWIYEKTWYSAVVTDTRTEHHTVRHKRTLCREIRCVYELDSHEQWHSLHNNKVRPADTAGTTYCVRYTASLAQPVCKSACA